MLKTFIERPVLSTVISLIIVVLGIMGIITLPVEQYPDIAPPTVQIQAYYSGANAQVVQKSVIIPIEEQVNGVEGMTYMSSSATNSGSATITVNFEAGTDPDIAAVKVQNLVAQASSLLPQEVTQTGVTVQKRQTSTIMFVSISSENPDYDAEYIQNYANINVLPQIKRVKGVGDANVFGAKDYSMRVWFKPEVMTSYKITPTEVIAALQDQNVEAAPGELGQNSDQSFQYTLKYTGRLETEEQFGDIVIRSENGQILRLKDVADVELGSLNYSVMTKMDGNQAIMIGINQASGSNAQEVINNVKDVLTRVQLDPSFPPGAKITYMMDANEFLDESISKVLHTLIEAFILVFIVVFVFLQDFRSTLIPALAVPVAIIGTFFFLLLFGFTINMLTLFALVLAIGIVVDDAIVVVEAVHAQLESGEKDPKKATMMAMKEIAPAIVSITLVMAAVFLPVSFVSGTSGAFYKQFGLTLAVAILISAINALTLSPALCALFLKPHKDDPNAHKSSFIKRFFYAFNLTFNASTSKYKTSLHFLGRRGNRWITAAIIAISSVIFAGLIWFTPSDLIPGEDGGVAMGIISLPPGASLERTDSIVGEITKITSAVPGVHHVANITGVNFMSGMGSSYASIIVKLDPWAEREMSANEIVAELTKKTEPIKGADSYFLVMPTLQGFGMAQGVELQLQDRTGGDINRFYEVASDFVAKMRAREDVMMVMMTFDPSFPQKQIDADIAKIKDAGLTLGQVIGTMQAYVGSMYVSNFNLYGKQFRVMVQAAPEYRSKLDDLNNITVKTASGEMAPITEFLTITDVTGPQALSRFNLYSSMSVMIIPNFAQGKSTGDMITAVEEVAKDLPTGYGYEYAGLSRETANSGNQIIMVFALCIIFIYLLLAALYESYILPFAVLLSLPVGLAGVFIFVFVGMISGTGIMNNVYVQISLIMLIGLLSKNAILIVEYAIQRRNQGQSIVEAAVNGAVARLRPILMTSFAFIFGLLPLAFASGAGAIGNKSIGVSAIGGMLIGTMIGILVIPSLYIIFQSIQEKLQGGNKKELK